MYAYITGKLAEKGHDYVVIEAGGVGYRIFTNTHALSSLPSEHAKLFTHFVVKENEQSLYGFVTEPEKEMFEKLIGISGVGPKMALSVLTTLSVSELAAAIISSDIAAFSPVSGVGKKMAERIILELREKVTNDNMLADIGGVAGIVNPESEAVNALVSLGYKRAEALKSIASVKNLGDTTEELILLALKRLG